MILRGPINHLVLVMKEKAYWEARHRQGTSSGSACIDWNWDKEICEVTNCVRKGSGGECIVSMGYQRAWKWKIIGEMVRRYSPELLESRPYVHSPHAPRAPLVKPPRVKVAGAWNVDLDSEDLGRELDESGDPPCGPILPRVIDVGCGDLTFWDAESLRLVNPLSWHTHEIMLTEEYIGIDISDAVIIRNRLLNKYCKFIASSSHVLNQGLKAPVVFCIDLLFHIMDDLVFIETLKNLCHYSDDLVLIHTWKHNPFEDSTSDGIYQKYRPLEAFFGIFMELDFTLMEERPNPNQIGCMYVFKQGDGHARYMY